MRKYIQRRWFSSIDPRQAKVRIVTGTRRGAGTHANVFYRLQDENGQWSATYFLGNSKFDAGSIFTHNVELPEKFGNTQSMHIGHDNSDIGAGWFLERVLYDDDHDLHLSFPCRRWLGDADSSGLSGPPERDLYPYSPADMKPLDFPFTCKISSGGTPAQFKIKKKNPHLCKINPKLGYAGEDSYFREQIDNFIFFGCADGVYEWNERGIDPALFSRALIKSISENVNIESSLTEIIKKSYDEVLELKIKGSCTVALSKLDLETQKLFTYVLGDSRTSIMRKRSSKDEYFPFWYSNELEHRFGCPKQLGHHEASSQPEDGEESEVKTQVNDVILCASDGLYDNLHGEQITHIFDKHLLNLNPGKKKRFDVPLRELVSEAYFISMDPHSDTPYSRAATEEFEMIYQGGKQDDIVCVGILCEPIPKETL